RASARMRGDLCFFDALHAEGALLHDAAHPHRDVWVLLHLHRVRRALGRYWCEILFVYVESARAVSLADRPLIVIEIIKAPDLIWAVVRAKASADAAVVSHDI